MTTRTTPHAWPDNIKDARLAQDALLKDVLIAPLKKPPKSIAALDAAFGKGKAVAAACLYSYPDLRLIEKNVAALECAFPYVPGYLGFREGPAMLAALKGLRTRPNLLLVDGQGIAHPRGMGIAAHLGVLAGVPSIGCAKSRLTGEYREPGPLKGDSSPLLGYGGKPIGVVLRSRDRVKPLFVSPGHMVDIEGAKEIVLSSCLGFRLPEPLRCADRASKEAAKML